MIIMMRRLRWIILPAALLLLAQPICAQQGRSAYERMEPARLADALTRMKMSQLLASLVSQAGDSVDGKLLLAKDKVSRALRTTDQVARDRLIDEALAIYAELIKASENATKDEDVLRHYRLRLDRIVLAALTKSKPYIERVQYFLARSGDKAAIVRFTGPQIRELNKLLRDMKRIGRDWHGDVKKMVTGVLWKMEELTDEARYRGAWIRFYNARALDPVKFKDKRRMLLSEAAEDVAKYVDAEDNDSGVKYSSLLLAGMAKLELDDWKNCRALLKSAAAKENPSAGERLKAMFEFARSFIAQEDFAGADREIATFRKQGAAVGGMSPAIVDLQATLLQFRRLFAEAESVAKSNQGSLKVPKALVLERDIIEKLAIPLNGVTLQVRHCSQYELKLRSSTSL